MNSLDAVAQQEGGALRPLISIVGEVSLTELFLGTMKVPVTMRFISAVRPQPERPTSTIFSAFES